MEISLQWRWSEVLIEIFQRPWDVLHEDTGLLLQMVVLDIPDDILMMDFRQNGDLHLALLLVLLAEMDLLHCGKHSIVDVKCLVDTT